MTREEESGHSRHSMDYIFVINCFEYPKLQKPEINTQLVVRHRIIEGSRGSCIISKKLSGTDPIRLSG